MYGFHPANTKVDGIYSEKPSLKVYHGLPFLTDTLNVE